MEEVIFFVAIDEEGRRNDERERRGKGHHRNENRKRGRMGKMVTDKSESETPTRETCDKEIVFKF